MRKTIKLVALAAIVAATMASCAGKSSSDAGAAGTAEASSTTSESLLFGELPALHIEMQAAKDAIKEEGKQVKTEAQFKELAEKEEKIKAEYTAKIEEAAKALNGNAINLTDGDIKVTEPVALTYEGFFSKTGLTPKFSVSGKAEAAADFTPETKYPQDSYTVYVVGFDGSGQEVFSSKIGFIAAVKEGGKSVVKAGTPVKFDNMQFGAKKAADYQKATSLKLMVQ